MARYLFIDGASLQETFADFKKRLYPENAIEIDYVSIAIGCDKVFYYDCFPVQGGQENETDFNLRFQAQKQFFDRLHTLDKWHVSHGVLKRAARKSSPRQKEVDTLIAVDMMAHTFRKNMSSLVFVTSDLDFRPLLEEVGRWGMSTALWYQRGHADPDLLHAADERVAMTAGMHWQWIQASSRPHPQCPELGYSTGSWSGRPLVEELDHKPGAHLYEFAGKYTIVWPRGTPSGSQQLENFQLSHVNKDFLKRWFALEYQQKTA